MVLFSAYSHSKWCPLAVGLLVYLCVFTRLLTYYNIRCAVHGIEVFSMGIRQTELLLRFEQNDDLIHIEISFSLFFPFYNFL